MRIYRDKERIHLELNLHSVMRENVGAFLLEMKELPAGTWGHEKGLCKWWISIQHDLWFCQKAAEHHIFRRGRGKNKGQSKKRNPRHSA